MNTATECHSALLAESESGARQRILSQFIDDFRRASAAEREAAVRAPGLAHPQGEEGREHLRGGLHREGPTDRRDEREHPAPVRKFFFGIPSEIPYVNASANRSRDWP